MITKYSLTILLTLISMFSFGQNIDSLKLTDEEIPKDYTKLKELSCVTSYAYSFYMIYTQDEKYSFFGKVARKDFQSFDFKNDKGAILYFEFEKDFNGQGFLDGLLWGKGTKPSESEPDEYFAKGKILVIWSFHLESEIKKISKEKVRRILKW